MTIHIKVEINDPDAGPQVGAQQVNPELRRLRLAIKANQSIIDGHNTRAKRLRERRQELKAELARLRAQLKEGR